MDRGSPVAESQKQHCTDVHENSTLPWAYKHGTKNPDDTLNKHSGTFIHTKKLVSTIPPDLGFAVNQQLTEPVSKNPFKLGLKYLVLLLNWLEYTIGPVTSKLKIEISFQYHEIGRVWCEHRLDCFAPYRFPLHHPEETTTTPLLFPPTHI
jgi:hypothetical protein